MQTRPGFENPIAVGGNALSPERTEYKRSCFCQWGGMLVGRYTRSGSSTYVAGKRGVTIFCGQVQGWLDVSQAPLPCGAEVFALREEHRWVKRLRHLLQVVGTDQAAANFVMYAFSWLVCFW